MQKIWLAFFGLASALVFSWFAAFHFFRYEVVHGNSQPGVVTLYDRHMNRVCVMSIRTNKMACDIAGLSGL